MLGDLPERWDEFSQWGWENIAPYANDLIGRQVEPETLETWLADWSRLARLITETFNRLQIRTTTHTNDEEGKARFRSYSERVMPNARDFEQTMRVKLVESGLEPEGLGVPLRKMRNDAAIYREQNLRLQSEIEGLSSDLNSITGAMSVDWDGTRLNREQVFAMLGEQDRNTRERAWRALSECLKKDRQAMDRIWVQLLDLRLQMARNAGFSDYRSFRWQELARFYYTPSDCRAFHAAIQEVVVPAVGRISQTRKARLSIEKVTVWDDFWHWAPDPLGRAPLRPFQSVPQMTAALQQLFTRLDPVLGSYYQTLREEQLMDLEARQFKAPGAYMQELPASRRPFVFSNSVGLHYDVLAQFHESGHAFHVFESAHWPYHYQSMIDHAATEFAEVASMSMELLASQHMTTDRGGFYTEHESAQARIGQLTQILKFWPYMAVVDGFQHWVYENPDMARNTARCDEQWATLHRLFLPHLDWSGAEETLGLCWRLQDHILLSPFYYIEYGIAQLGAIQIWANSLAEPAAALRSYRSALALGNTAALPELFKAAGTRFEFDVETLREATALIERTITQLQAG